MIRLVLPLPPSGNRGKSSNHFASHRIKDEYRQRAWGWAIRQHLPLHVEDLPPKASVTFTLYVTAIRDEDNADWARKWIADTLKQKQTGAMKWRQGAYDEKGYFLDDAPRYCSLQPVEQVLCKRGEERVEVTIEAVQQEAA